MLGVSPPPRWRRWTPRRRGRWCGCSWGGRRSPSASTASPRTAPPPSAPPEQRRGRSPHPPPTPNSSTGKRRRSPEGRTAKQSRAPPHWLRRDLRVRCVDRGFRGGRFYNCKMQVEDLLSPDSCVCRTDDGRLVEGECGSAPERPHNAPIMPQ
eukprot:XP_024999705.1 serine/arginine repetitive matrix protein 1-like [Gallus gallus]